MMLRVCALENACATSSRAEDRGREHGGLKTLGLKTDGENTEGEKTEGLKTLGLKTDGEKTDGREDRGAEDAGLKTDGEKTEGLYASGLNTDGEKTEGEKTDGEKTDGAYSALSCVSAAASAGSELRVERLADVLEHGQVVVGREPREADLDPLPGRDGELVPACLAGRVDEVACGCRRRR